MNYSGIKERNLQSRDAYSSSLYKEPRRQHSVNPTLVNILILHLDVACDMSHADSFARNMWILKSLWHLELSTKILSKSTFYTSQPRGPCLLVLVCLKEYEFSAPNILRWKWWKWQYIIIMRLLHYKSYDKGTWTCEPNHCSFVQCVIIDGYNIWYELWMSDIVFWQ